MLRWRTLFCRKCRFFTTYGRHGAACPTTLFLCRTSFRCRGQKLCGFFFAAAEEKKGLFRLRRFFFRLMAQAGVFFGVLLFFLRVFMC